MPTFYEFFAGGGMVRAGLGEAWECVFANDIDPRKAASYKANWGNDVLKVEDVRKLTAADLPGQVDLAWASFPCQDLSLAGNYVGLDGERSGTFWPFWNLMKALVAEVRAPRLVVLENVCGAITSHGGRDFAAICGALREAGYRYGALVIDAIRFVPQSRPRLFIAAVKQARPAPSALVNAAPSAPWHPAGLIRAHDGLSGALKEGWVWWRLPLPPRREARLRDLIEEQPVGVEWHDPEETRQLLRMMSPVNRRKVEQAKRMGRRMIGTVYRRTRSDGNGGRLQRAEVRFDDVSGCLRTPVGGSSRQIVIVVEGEEVRSRLLSPREAARLMGLPDTYKLPERYNEAYHLIADGVVVPVVRFLAQHLLEPLLGRESEQPGEEEAA
ncbi:MAG TPA: DNA cytosine methyltransferase [Bryobacteraceae bacterium]|nr:DNA cytosine methyltransferase [Bryobacteraceae bacterium]